MSCKHCLDTACLLLRMYLLWKEPPCTLLGPTFTLNVRLHLAGRGTGLCKSKGNPSYGISPEDNLGAPSWENGVESSGGNPATPSERG